MIEKEFKIFLGIDQTGALKSNKKNCIRLPACLLFYDRESKLKVKTLQHSLSLLELSLDSVSNLLNEISSKEKIDMRLPDLAVLVDSVFGLPYKSFPKDRNIYSLIGTSAEYPYGMMGAKAFFDQFDYSDNSFLRCCDEIAGANSVFKTYPMQRNVQTGTFRVWKDLSKDKAFSFNLWPFCLFAEPLAELPWLFEAYPAGLAKTLLGLKNRKYLDVSNLNQILKEPIKVDHSDIDFLNKSQDYKDALINSLSGFLLNQNKRLIYPFDGFLKNDFLNKEGWMAGLSFR